MQCKIYQFLEPPMTLADKTYDQVGTIHLIRTKFSKQHITAPLELNNKTVGIIRDFFTSKKFLWII